MSAGGFHINQHKVTSTEEVVTADSHVLPSGLTLLRVGKSRDIVWTDTAGEFQLPVEGNVSAQYPRYSSHGICIRHSSEKGTE